MQSAVGSVIVAGEHQGNRATGSPRCSPTRALCAGIVINGRLIATGVGERKEKRHGGAARASSARCAVVNPIPMIRSRTATNASDGFSAAVDFTELVRFSAPDQPIPGAATCC